MAATSSEMGTADKTNHILYLTPGMQCATCGSALQNTDYYKNINTHGASTSAGAQSRLMQSQGPCTWQAQHVQHSVCPTHVQVCCVWSAAGLRVEPYGWTMPARTTYYTNYSIQHLMHIRSCSRNKRWTNRGRGGTGRALLLTQPPLA